jgi:hypothetical protein
VAPAIDEITESSGIWQYTKYLSNKVGAALNTCSDYLGITSVMEQIQSHSLKNFSDIENATIVLTDQWTKVGDKLVVQKFPGSDKITSTGNDVVLFNEEEYSSMIHVTKEEYAFHDLSRATTCAQEYADLELVGNNSTYDLVFVY